MGTINNDVLRHIILYLKLSLHILYMNRFSGNTNHKFGVDRRTQVQIQFTLHKNCSVIHESKPDEHECDEESKNVEMVEIVEDKLPVQIFLEEKQEEAKVEEQKEPMTLDNIPLVVQHTLNKLFLDVRFKNKKAKK